MKKTISLEEEDFFFEKQGHRVITVGYCTYTIPHDKDCLIFSENVFFHTPNNFKKERR